MNDVVFYNMWGRERYQDYINLPFKYKEEHEWVTDLQKNNAYFLDHINEYASGPQKADYALTGFLDWYVKKRAANDGDAEYKREYYADWLNHTIFICDHKPGYEWVVDWCRRYLTTMNITKDGNSVLTETKMWNNGRTGDISCISAGWRILCLFSRYNEPRIVACSRESNCFRLDCLCY